MVTIEEYIAQRRKADNLDMNDIYSKSNNMDLCINYVVDYFNEYVENDHKKILRMNSYEGIQLNELDKKTYMALTRFFIQYNVTAIKTTTEFKTMFSVNLTTNRLTCNLDPLTSYNVRGLGRISLMRICALDSDINIIR